MSEEDIKSYDQLPVPESKRGRSDVFCTVCTSVFALIIFIICLACLNTDNLAKMTFPADGEGNLCGWDVPEYPLLYYTSLNDPSKRLCVKSCPQQGDIQLSCYATKSLSCFENKNEKYEVQIYSSEIDHNRIGLFCLPTNEEAKASMMEKSGLNDKYQFLGFYDSMWNSLWISTVLGIAYLVAIQCFPQKVIPWSVVIGGIFFIILALLTIIIIEGFILLKILAFLFFGGLGGLALYCLIDDEYRKALRICTRLLECATEVVSYDYKLFLYIPIFCLFLVGLIFLTAFEILAVWSIAQQKFDPNFPFYETQGFVSILFCILIFFQFLWGLSFIKEAYNFCLSGYATNWYYFRVQKESEISLLKSPQLMLKYHWGSVVGGSLLLGFLYFFDLFLDFFFSNDTDVTKREWPNQPFTRQQLSQEKVNSQCLSFFNLVRSQSMGYINLIPIPYCNASRYSEYLSEESSFYDHSQTINRIARLAAHALLVGIVSFVAIGIMEGSGGSQIMGFLMVMIISLFTVTLFVSFHGDVAEGILISIFIEEKLTRGVKQPPKMIQQVYEDDISNRFEQGNTLCEVLF